ncbi:MAG: SUMF1/EgtB/PvdO family nonheme iron enzyme [Bacteroidaceae bacterium]|nr:SUMF1/EgtB/PvdO family nonheme iron enzyme [Bacteroidaceae bacterium]
MGSNRVNRGGSWNNNPQNCRASNRNNNTPDNRNNNLGLRLVLQFSFINILIFTINGNRVSLPACYAK